MRLKITEPKTVRVGRCIYCGSTQEPLSREHIIPFGLNGKWVLSKASCANCSNITSRIEEDVLRHILKPVRASFNTRTYRRKHPDNFPLVIEKDGKKVSVDVPIEKLGGAMVLLGYKLPAYLDDRPYKHGIDVTGSYLVRGNGIPLEELAKQLGTKSISYSVTYKEQNFERFLAKVGYGMALIHYGIDSFEKVYVLPALMRNFDDIGKWVGSLGPTRGKEDLTVTLEEKNKDVIAYIRLFGKWPVPTYVVVVGKLR